MVYGAEVQVLNSIQWNYVTRAGVLPSRPADFSEKVTSFMKEKVILVMLVGLEEIVVRNSLESR
jgi:hypothetical protein